MKFRNISLSFTLLILFSAFLHAQTVLTANDILNLHGNSFNYTVEEAASFGVNVGSPGANQMWDFSNHSFINPFDLEYIYSTPDQTPYDTLFPNANSARQFIDLRDSTFSFYEYWNIQPNIADVLGSAVYLPDLDTVFVEREQGVDIPLPMQMGNSWMQVEYDTSGFPPFVSIDIDTVWLSVDGWGTLKLPSGDYDCIRIREDVVSTNYLLSDTTLIPIGFESWIAYIWVSPDYFELLSVQSQFGNMDPNFTSAQGLTMIDIVTSIEDESPAPGVISEFYLEQNYPNPFNPITQIRFAIPKSSMVSLTIYNALGQVVETLVSGQLSAGEHQVQWHATDQPSGIYYYRIDAGEFSETKKAILLK